MLEGFKNWVAVLVALVVIAGLAITMTYMFRHLDSAQWDRMVYLFGAIEALGFSGAGFLWGREVHREAAVDAKKDADASKQDAKTSSDKAAQAKETAATAVAHGEDLADLIRAKAETKPAHYNLLFKDQPHAANAVGGEMTELLAFADRLFPKTR